MFDFIYHTRTGISNRAAFFLRAFVCDSDFSYSGVIKWEVEPKLNPFDPFTASAVGVVVGHLAHLNNLLLEIHLPIVGIPEGSVAQTRETATTLK